jgi:predicted dienelactone hydrolase
MGSGADHSGLIVLLTLVAGLLIGFAVAAWKHPERSIGDD